MEISIESSALMNAIFPIVSEVLAMNKTELQNEAAFLVTMNLLKEIRDKKLITGKEYQEAEQQMLDKYKPFWGSLFTC